jgi:uncharacterized protein DUF1761
MELSDFAKLNYLAVLAGAVAYWLLGALWYSPVLFGKRWGTITGITGENAGSPVVTYLGGLVILFVQVAGLAFLAAATGIVRTADYIQLGLGVGIAFCAMQLVLNQMYEKRSGALLGINAGYAILGLTLAAFVLSLID